MSLTLVIILLVVLAVGLIGGLAFVMSRPTQMRPHQRRSGRPAARMRFYRGRTPRD